MSQSTGIALRLSWLHPRVRLVLLKPIRLVRSARDQIDIRVLGRLFNPGSVPWLIERESHFGGYFSQPQLLSWSPLDSRRTSAQGPLSGNEGGDRMARRRHGYSAGYSKWLRYFRKKQLVIVELGVLRGTGLALWSDLFKDPLLIALDIDFQPFNESIEYLRGKGAFSERDPKLIVFDAYLPKMHELLATLGSEKIDIFIDDGPHDLPAVIATAASMRILMSERSVYIVEDALECADALSDLLSDYVLHIEPRGLLVLERGLTDIGK